MNRLLSKKFAQPKLINVTEGILHWHLIKRMFIEAILIRFYQENFCRIEAKRNFSKQQEN